MRNRPEMTAILKWRWLLFVPFCAVWGLAFESLAGVAGKAVLSLSAGLICGQFMRRRPYSKRKRFCLGPASVAGLFVCWNYSLGFAVKLAALRCNECLSGMAVLWLAGCISLAAIPLLFLLQSRRVLLLIPVLLPGSVSNAAAAGARWAAGSTIPSASMADGTGGSCRSYPVRSFRPMVLDFI